MIVWRRWLCFCCNCCNCARLRKKAFFAAVHFCCHQPAAGVHVRIYLPAAGALSLLGGGGWGVLLRIIMLAERYVPLSAKNANKQQTPFLLSWKCRFFRCRPLLVLKTCLRVFPTRRPNTADVSATSCDVGFFFSVSYVVSLPNCRHVVVVNPTHQP